MTTPTRSEGTTLRDFEFMYQLAKWYLDGIRTDREVLGLNPEKTYTPDLCVICLEPSPDRYVCWRHPKRNP